MIELVACFPSALICNDDDIRVKFIWMYIVEYQFTFSKSYSSGFKEGIFKRFVLLEKNVYSPVTVTSVHMVDNVYPTKT